ncbi:hypothetical protein Leryth_002064 [Lithospermum erythrorhizon]|nr:hypothetical protein Leryth_002064 [Lithospermum erythrorhizon]
MFVQRDFFKLDYRYSQNKYWISSSDHDSALANAEQVKYVTIFQEEQLSNHPQFESHNDQYSVLLHLNSSSCFITTTSSFKSLVISDPVSTKIDIFSGHCPDTSSLGTSTGSGDTKSDIASWSTL